MLNQAKREEQQQKLLEMAEAKERQEVAEERASRLRVKGRDGDEAIDVTNDRGVGNVGHPHRLV